MRTNVVIDETLMAEAMKYSELSTKKAVIEEALRTFVRLKSQEQVRKLRGKLHWEGDLDAVREGRLFDTHDPDKVEPSHVDCLIATFVIERGHTLLHNDRDFEPFERHLGLDVVQL